MNDWPKEVEASLCFAEVPAAGALPRGRGDTGAMDVKPADAASRRRSDAYGGILPMLLNWFEVAVDGWRSRRISATVSHAFDIDEVSENLQRRQRNAYLSRYFY